MDISHITSGITYPTLQPQLVRFLHTLAIFKFPAKDSISCWQKADGKRLTQSAVDIEVIRNLVLNSRRFSAQAVQCAR